MRSAPVPSTQKSFPWKKANGNTKDIDQDFEELLRRRAIPGLVAEHHIPLIDRAYRHWDIGQRVDILHFLLKKHELTEASLEHLLGTYYIRSNPETVCLLLDQKSVTGALRWKIFQNALAVDYDLEGIPLWHRWTGDKEELRLHHLLTHCYPCSPENYVDMCHQVTSLPAGQREVLDTLLQDLWSDRGILDWPDSRLQAATRELLETAQRL